MDRPGLTADWWESEREYTDAVVGEDTIPELFEAAAERHSNNTAQRYKGGIYPRSLTDDVVPEAPRDEYAGITYQRMREVVRHLAAGFRDLGVGGGDRVGIYSDTRMEWALSDFSLLAAGGTVTTVYTESSSDQVRYLLDDPDATGVVVENGALAKKVFDVEDDLDLEFVVVIDEYETDRDDVYTLADIYERGESVFDEDEYQSWLTERDLPDLASLIYTSGTTGQPKGVELTHGNFRANVNQVRKRMAPRPDKSADAPTIDEHSKTVSFLPLAHVFERIAGHFVMFASGATVGYAESPDTLVDDLGKLRPTTGGSVPRVYERIFDGMREQSSESPINARIFEWAVGVAREYTRADSPGVVLNLKHAIADRLVFETVRDALGGNVEVLVSGGGSLSQDLAELFLGMGVPIVEGYGLTETAPVISVNPVEDIRPGTLGPPMTDIDVRIDESMVTDDQFPEVEGTVGELQVDGPNVTDGYWNRPEATDEAFTDDGYFRTGDIVELSDDGYLTFKDRLKQLIVLDTGKNVAPGPIEDKFATNDRVDQVMVVGDNQKFIGGVIVPNFEGMERWADREGIDLPPSRQGKLEDDRVYEWVEEAVEDVNATLAKSERIKQFELVPTEWTAENDLLTPSMKKKRRNIEEENQEAIERIYESEKPPNSD
jgi:long-chain acyl-CoA synthetase